MNFKMIHENYNVFDLQKSMAFYEEALGLREVRRKEAEDGSFIIVYMGSEEGNFLLELHGSGIWSGHIIWAIVNSIWRSTRTIIMRHMKNIKQWAVSAMRIRQWASISLLIPMDTGWKSYHKKQYTALMILRGIVRAMYCFLNIFHTASSHISASFLP